MPYRQGLQLLHHVENILWAVNIAIRPVFEVQIDFQSLIGSIFDGPAYPFEMLRQALSQLFPAVLFTAFGKQIHHFPTCRRNPVDTARVIDKSEDFDLSQVPLFIRPYINVPHCFTLAIGYSGGRDFDAVYLDRVQK